MDFKKYLAKLQNLSEGGKKAILFSVIGVLAIILLFLWFNSAVQKVNGIKKSLQTDKLPFLNLPNLDINKTVTNTAGHPDITATTTPGNESPVVSKNISEKDAINLVKSLPVVKNWLSLFSQPDGTSPKTGGKPFIDLDHQDANSYFIHLYELQPDHLATFNWYNVDKKTGNIKSEF